MVWAARLWALSRARALVTHVITPASRARIEYDLSELIRTIDLYPEYPWLFRVRRFVSQVRGEMLHNSMDDGSVTVLREEARQLWRFIDKLTLGVFASPMELMEEFIERHNTSSWRDVDSYRAIGGLLRAFHHRSANPTALCAPAREERLLLRFSVDPETDEDEAAEAIYSIIHALSALHVEMGGSGLQLDDWQPLVSENASVEVAI